MQYCLFFVAQALWLMLVLLLLFLFAREHEVVPGSVSEQQ